MTVKLTRLTHKIAIQLDLVAESCTICGSRSRRAVRKLLVTPSYAQRDKGILLNWLVGPHPVRNRKDLRTVKGKRIIRIGPSWK